ncbi:hypothetical protein [Marinicella meishanensis]|uniref:hypothetical protein n=1 Tax=Marinicella meishanensis TaxID=2873263 RepID=UPI001CBE605A|nr:hypothetical protein [Marinicella sp. NBU2979]
MKRGWLNNLVGMLMVHSAMGGTAADNQPATRSEALTEQTAEQEADDIQPDKALLLFLAEWDETQDGQWLQPTDFAADSSFTQQLESPQPPDNTLNNHEYNPDHH